MSDPKNFAEIEDKFVRGRDYEVQVEARLAKVVILAPHGGRIEPFTTELARLVAGSDWSFYSLIGRLASGNRRLHLPSHRFDHAPALALVENADYAVSIHGAQGDESADVLLGGQDLALLERVGNSLAKANFSLVDPPQRLSGSDSGNVVNRTQRGGGVQIEVTRALRRQLRRSPRRRSEFVEAIREAIIAELEVT